jgi:hypothetical protein
MSEDAPWDSDSFGVLTCRPSQLRHIATRAAQWGADQELEACCDHIRDRQWGFVDQPDGTKGMHRAVDLKLARRPKPPSLKEQALTALSHLLSGSAQTLDTTEAEFYIREALEALTSD